jgi:hypothetical protein
MCRSYWNAEALVESGKEIHWCMDYSNGRCCWYGKMCKDHTDCKNKKSEEAEKDE